jgi:phospholipid/cholesterol/gamma-HCH transport system permease protein
MTTSHYRGGADPSIPFFSLSPGFMRLSGRWTIADSVCLDKQLLDLRVSPGTTLEIDGSGLQGLDSTGAWLIVRTTRVLEQAGCNVSGVKVPGRYDRLLNTVNRKRDRSNKSKVIPYVFGDRLYRIGKATALELKQGSRILSYLGRIAVESVEMIVAPRKNLRLAAIVHQVEECGVSALPIVGLLAFLVGVVLAYQGADQLRQFGAEIFTINLLGVGMLRELGGLITAIIVAGRSGSAFTAHLGTMRVNEEIDAMQTMGLNTADTLVLPRIIGLVISLPILTFLSDVLGIAGGAALCYLQLGITIPCFHAPTYRGR